MKEKDYTYIGDKVNDTGFGYTMSLISGKYKLLILYCISKFNVIRYNELRRCLGNIAHKTLSSSLKELQADDLIIRTEYPQVPPKVEYTLSTRGESLIPILIAMCKWGELNRD